MLEVRLLGELDLRQGGQQLRPVESARARELIGRLALGRGVALPRQRLAFELWPDSTESQARTNLRHLSHTVRSSHPELDEHIEITAQTIRWHDAETCCWTDVGAFEQALTTASAADDESVELEALVRAIDLYRGHLLSSSYEDWIGLEREQLRGRHVAALERATQLTRERGDFHSVIRFARKLVRDEPGHEVGYRHIIAAHLAVGDRFAGLRAFHECSLALQREFGIDPAPATLRLYEQLLHAEEADRTQVTAPPTRSTALLIGRAAELAKLERWWNDAEGGHRRLVVITGEPGIGKSRIAEELAIQCTGRGILIGRARSYAAEGDIANGVIAEWLRDLDIDAVVRRGPATDRLALAQLLPELLDVGETIPAAEESEQRRRLFAAVARTISSIGRPVLLIADDAQWSDESSLQFLHYLIRQERPEPLLVLVTARREDVDDDHPLARITATLQSIDRVSELMLHRLDRHDTAQLIASLADAEPDPETVGRVFDETEGNPLFVVETMRSRQHGASPSAGLGPRLQSVIAARLADVEPPARALIGVAAVVGRAFTSKVLREATGVDEVELVRGLDELWRRGIIREQGTDDYDFSHGKLREVAYEGLSNAMRRRNHLLVARALLRVHGDDLGPVAAAIAGHLDRSGDAAEAVIWYRRAARWAQQVHANADAVRFLERGRALIDTLPESPARAALELDVVAALPTPLCVVKGFAAPELFEAQQRALSLSAALGRALDPSLLRSLVMSNLCRHDFKRAAETASQLLDRASELDDPVLDIESRYLLGISAFWGGSFEDARGHFEHVVGVFDPARRADHLVRFGQDSGVVSLGRLANTFWFLDQPDRARQTRDEALRASVAAGEPFSRAIALVFAAVLSLDLDDRDILRSCVASLTADGNEPMRIMLDAFGGYVDVLDGRPGDGVARIRAAIDARPLDQAPGQRALMGRLLVGAHAAAHDPRGGLAAADFVLALRGSRIWEPAIRRLRTEFEADLESAPSSFGPAR